MQIIDFYVKLGLIKFYVIPYINMSCSVLLLYKATKILSLDAYKCVEVALLTPPPEIITRYASSENYTNPPLVEPSVAAQR